MSVVVRRPDGKLVAYVKGAFEKMKTLCDPKTVPDDFLPVAKQHALGLLRSAGAAAEQRQGGRPQQDVQGRPRPSSTSSALSFPDELKHDTAAATPTSRRRRGGVMITGTTPTAAATSRGPRTSSPPTRASSRRGRQDGRRRLDGAGAQGATLATHDVAKMSAEDADCELAMTGRRSTPGRVGGPRRPPADAARRRRGPEGPHRQEAGRGFVVTMTGDGSSDCGALRAAPRGRRPQRRRGGRRVTLHVQVQVHRERRRPPARGRCALATSFASYKFLITYGQLFSCLKLVCFWYGVIMCMMDYVTVDVDHDAGAGVHHAEQALDTLRTERPTSCSWAPRSSSPSSAQAFNIVIIAKPRDDANDRTTSPGPQARGRQPGGSSATTGKHRRLRRRRLPVPDVERHLLPRVQVPPAHLRTRPSSPGSPSRPSSPSSSSPPRTGSGLTSGPRSSTPGAPRPVWRDYQSKIGDGCDAFESGDPAYDGDDPTSPKMSVDLRVKLFLLVLFGPSPGAFELVSSRGQRRAAGAPCDDKAPASRLRHQQ